MRLRIEGVQVLPAGCFALKRGQGEVGPQAVQDSHDLFPPVRAGQETGDLLRPARIIFLNACMSTEVLPEPGVPAAIRRRLAPPWRRLHAGGTGEGLAGGAVDQDGKYILRALKYG
ncbi:MAG: hypothetical protein ACP5PV_08485 [Methanothrix sp.]